MTDLKCKKCGMEALYGDAQIEDWRRTCPGENAPGLPSVTEENAPRRQGGHKHDWK